MMTTNSNIPPGYKDSAVGIIPQEWDVKRLVDLCHNTGDYGINAPAVSYREDLPTYLRITDIDGWGKFIETDKVSVDNPNSSQFILRDGDIVFARTGATVGKTYLYDSKDGQLVFAGFLIRFTPNSNKAVPYYIKACSETASYWNWVRVISQRSGQPGINSVEYGAMKLAVPPMEEQRKIAEILGVWDEAIEKQSRLIEKLELRKRALMQRLLTGRTRLPAFTTPWQKVKLGEIFKERNETKCEHLPLLSITAERGVILQSESDKKDTSNDDKSKYKRIYPNDIGYNTMRMWQGRSALSAMEGIVSPAYTIVTPKVGIDPLFISELIKQPRVVYDFWTHSQGLVGDTLNCKFHDFSQVKVAIPSLPEQKAIAEVLTVADKEIAIHRKKLDALRQQKRGLMQQLLTGKTRVKI